MVILTTITTNNYFNNANFVTKIILLCSEWHNFKFLLKKLDFLAKRLRSLDKMKIIYYNEICNVYILLK